MRFATMKASHSVIAFVCLLVGCLSAPTYAQDRTWNLNADGSWNTNGNWDPTDAPNTDAENAIVTSPDGTTAVTVSLAGGVTRELGDLTILDNGPNPAHTVAVPNNTFFDIHGDIQNDGVIELNSTGNFTRLRLDGSDLLLSGSGTLNLGAGAFNAVSNALGTNTLINGASHTIAGGGRLGDNSIGVSNAGSIDANLSGATMTIDPSSALGLANTGTMSASSGGVLLLTGLAGGDFDNTGGVIEATGAGSEVQLDLSATVIGGTVRGTGGGLVRIGASENGFFTDVTFEGALQSDNSSDFGISGLITNNGVITIESSVNTTSLEVQAGGATLAGTGSVVLTTTGSGVPGIDGNSDAVLTNGASHTIEGQGFLGGNSANLINNGLVDANVSGATLTVDPDPTIGVDNNATMRASGGGIMLLTSGSGGDFDNTGGVIEAVGAGSEIRLDSSASITGGTVRGTGGGIVRAVAGENAFFTDVTFEGVVQSDNNTDFGISGTITNNGVVTIVATSNATDVEVQSGGATLAGSGSLVLDTAGGSISRINGISGSVLTNGASHTIEGRGDVGGNAIGVVNNGVINANVSGETLLVNPDSASGLDNNATMRATGGGFLQLVGSGGGVFDNDGGVIEATGMGSEILLSDGVNVTGGTLRAASDGLVRALAGQNVFLSDLTIEGPLLVNNNTDFGISDTINNTGAITIDSTGNATDIEVQSGGATLTGGGTITLQGPIARINSIGFATLTNNGNTIQGDGSLETPVVNNGAIAGNSDTEFIEVNRRLSGSGSLANVRIDNVHAPGDDVANVALSGDYTIASSGELHIDIGGLTPGAEYDRLSSTGDVTIDGDLVVSPIDLANGYVPAAGDEFTIITSTSPISGTFDTESLPLIFGSRVLLWDPVDYSDPMEVSLRIDVSVLGGDTDDDGDVDLVDLDTLGANFGTNGPGGPSIGDFDFDGDVDLVDLDILGANFLFGVSVAIPEPSAPVLLVSALGLTARRRR